MTNIILKITEDNTKLSAQILNQNHPKDSFRSSLGFHIESLGSPKLMNNIFFLRGYNNVFDNHTASKLFDTKKQLTTYKNTLTTSLKEWSAWMDKGNMKTLDPTIINFSNLKKPIKDIYSF